MKKILVPTDFTPASRQATLYAIALAKTFGAEIQLLHVYREMLPVTLDAEPWIATARELRAEVDRRLQHEVETLSRKYSIPITGDIQIGYKGDSINEVARESRADLVVMGMKNHQHVPVLGNTTTKAIRKSDVPILIVPEGTAFRALKNIVLAIDFNEMTGKSSVEPLIGIIKEFGASLKVLHIEKRGSDINASELPEKLQLGVVLSPVDYTYYKVEYDDIEQGILAFVESHPTDLLVMIAHHHTIMERLFRPIHTGMISFELNIPLLVLKNH